MEEAEPVHNTVEDQHVEAQEPIHEPNPRTEENENGEQRDTERRDTEGGQTATTMENVEISMSILRFSNLMILWSRSSIFFICYFVSLIISTVVVLAIDWDSNCNNPVKAWLIVLASLYTIMLLLVLRVYFGLPSQEEELLIQEHRIRRVFKYYLMNRCLDFFWFFWYVMGVAWTFSAESECRDSAPNIMNLCFAFVIIHSVLIVVVVISCLFSCCNVALQIMGSVEKAPPGASKKVIKALKMKKYQDGDISHEHANCGICLCDYEEGEDIRYLPCGHTFHSDCVDQWLRINKSCPYCKKLIDEDNEKDKKKENV